MDHICGKGVQNYYNELLTLKLFLILSTWKGIFKLQFFSGLILVITGIEGGIWNGKFVLNSFEKVNHMNSFNYISFSHVYNELNANVDSLSKKRLQLEAGFWLVMESMDGQVFEHIKRFYWLCIPSAESAYLPKVLILWSLVSNLLFTFM